MGTVDAVEGALRYARFEMILMMMKVALFELILWRDASSGAVILLEKPPDG